MEIELHRKLLGDGLRNRAFQRALEQLIEPGKTTVVDIGAGTGFLSLLAARLGAAHCTLVEYADTLELAQQLARANGITTLTFMRAHSQEIRKPPKVDLVISETLGNYALEEGLLETLVDARRFLKPRGRLIPGRLRQFVAPVVAPRLQQELDIWGQVGFDLELAPARRVSLNNMYVKTLRPDELAGADSARLWDDLDFSPAAKAPESKREKTVRWDAPLPVVHGFALWWECELVPGISISTSPWAEPTHWEQVYLPLLQPAELAKGDTMELSLGSDTRPEVGLRVTWKTRVLRGKKPVSEQSQDTFQGRL
ncbi:MAG TPA: class I SAM-dependent methyltransferase [Solimonas sp.]|nr:class I SAM-dependent methyltransferase [Solimonas sp.]